MILSPLRPWLLGALALLTLTSIYQVFNSTNELQQARETIRRTQTELSQVQDSLAQTQARLQRMLQEVRRSERVLGQVREQVATADQQYRAQRVDDAQERNGLLKQWQYQAARRQALRREAQTFSIE